MKKTDTKEFKNIILLIFPLFLTILVYIFFSLLTYKDYGITSDEFSSYISGQIWWEYFQNKPLTFNLARYNPLVNEHYRFYSMILFALIGSLKYETFHLLNMLAFIPVLITGFVLSKTVIKSSWIAIIPLVFILLTPRLLGDIPANPKDIPFTVAYFVGLGLVYFLNDKQLKVNGYVKVLVLGLFFGYMQSLRPIGFSIYFIYILWGLLNLEKKPKIFIAESINLGLQTLCILLISMFVMSATWPAIGSNYIANLKKYLSLGADFNLWDGKIFYLGKYFSGGETPWHYLFTWIGISTPVSHLFLFFTGIFLFVKKGLNKVQIYFYLVVITNIVLYFLLKPTLYNGIRHYSFLILIISFLAGLNFVSFVITLNNKIKIVFTSLMIIYLLLTTVTMVKLHPYEYIYFNETVGGLKGAVLNFDGDYWDSSYKGAAKELQKYTQELPIKVYSCGARTALDYYMGNSITQTKNYYEAEYIICDPKNIKKVQGEFKTLYTVERLGTPLVVIGKR